MLTQDDKNDLTRRGFLAGAVGVGVAAVAVGAVALSGCSSDEEDELSTVVAEEAGDADIETLHVATSQIIEGNDFDEVLVGEYLMHLGTWTFPLGTLVYQATNDTALLLLPVDKGDALRTLALLDLNTGDSTALLTSTVSENPSEVLYEARASATSLIWVECSLADQSWKVYTARLDALMQFTSGVWYAAAGAESVEGAEGAETATAVEPPPLAEIAQLVDEGNGDYDPPLLAISGDKAYWTVMPNPDGPANQEDSYLKTARVSLSGMYKPSIVHTSHGRMITNPLISDGIVTIVPRVSTTNVYYQLTAISVETDKTLSVSILPQSLRVNDAIFSDGRFAFGIEGNYDYAEGLNIFGTYFDIGDDSWLHVSRMPVSAPLFWNGCLIVKSTVNIIGFDTVNRRFFVIDTVADCADYGDVLVGWGAQDKIVSYTMIPARQGSRGGSTVLRVFGRLPAPESSDDEATDVE
ncbi:MAG: hypothetical protein LBS98_06995 [Coriobacteriales bacterium]|nr:hypothetical protein [Coriobacteriales bacterium]